MSVPEWQTPPCVVPNCIKTATANKTGLEQKLFEFDFTTTNQGPIFYITNKPSWLNMDSINTKIYGMPTSAGTFSNIKISIYDGTNTEEIGPFDLTITGDPFAKEAWHLNNTGQKSYSSGAGIADEDINILDALALGYTGLGVRVAVSDTGVEIAHEDLTDNILSGESRDYRLPVSPWLGDPTPTDPAEGHGTSVAGLIAAKGWNSKGSRGVAPNAQFASFYFLDPSITFATYIDQASGNFDIFNYSYGLHQCTIVPIDDLYLAQLKYGVENYRGGKGAIYIKAAGNNYIDNILYSDCTPNPSVCTYPYYFGNANFDGDNTSPYIITVGATNASGTITSYSTPGSNIWVSAPGGEYGIKSPAMITTDMSGCDMGLSVSANKSNSFESGSSPNSGCNYTSTMNGTSSATPVTSGVAALILEANNLLSWRDVKHILASSAKIIDPSSGNTNHPSGFNLSGYTYQQGWVTNAAGYKFHNKYGFGRVDAGAAVTM
ncbi:MAG: hypothetical protein A2Z20_04690, partial [Bdellovibrionales bacterium RBG_16_40_8]